MEKSQQEIEGLKKLERKKRHKIAGSVTFHVDDNGKVPKVEEKNIIK